MKYLYYPGCSLKSTGRAYEESLLAVFDALKIDYTEIDDWNCCGATAYMSVDETKAFTIAARNLALAEKQFENEEEINLIAPCAACYMVLLKTQNYLEAKPELREKVCGALKDAGLTNKRRVKVRHPLDVLINDISPDVIKSAVKHPLKGIKVASYYGCQTVRPYATFDDARDPITMDQIVRILGADPVEWPLKTRCCGGSLTGTVPEVGLPLTYVLLKEASRHGADVVVTACPLCQFNLECYQNKINNKFDDNINLPVIYFSQLIGLAFDIPQKKLGLQRVFIKPEKVYKTVKGGAPVYV